jgi:TctA family transporter
MFCCIGVYSLNSSVIDLAMATGFGIVGYILLKLDCEPAPLMLGFILGPMMETYFRRALVLSRGDLTVFFTEPISLIMLLVAAILLLMNIAPTVRRKREEVFQE